MWVPLFHIEHIWHVGPHINLSLPLIHSLIKGTLSFLRKADIKPVPGLIPKDPMFFTEGQTEP